MTVETAPAADVGLFHDTATEADLAAQWEAWMEAKPEEIYLGSSRPTWEGEEWVVQWSWTVPDPHPVVYGSGFRVRRPDGVEKRWLNPVHLWPEDSVSLTLHLTVTEEEESE